MTLRLSLLSLAFSLCAAFSAIAQDGSTAYDFLNLSSSTQVYGLGGMNISLTGADVNSIEQNPALLGNEMHNQLEVCYMRYIADSNIASVAYAREAGAHGAWAAMVKYFGYGSMKETDVSGNITGNFSASDVVFAGSVSYDFTDNLRGGINLKTIFSSYADFSAMAIASDIGLNYYDPDRDLSLSVVGANLGGQVKRFDRTYDRLPIDLRIGWSQSFENFPIRFSVTAWNLTKWHLPYYDNGDGTSGTAEKKDSFSSNLFRHLVFGADFIGSKHFSLGIGYNYKTRTDMNTYSRNMLSGFSLSAGLYVKHFSVGLALAQPHTGATTFMVNFTCDLNDILNI